jgi:uncharacterized oxidoreductase
MALAVPTPAPHPPLVLDFATSAIPEGKLAVLRANGGKAPPASLIDRDGHDSTEPADFYAGGALLPFGGHKGSALLFMIEILATTLAGAAPIALPDYVQGNPTFILAWSIDAFVAREVFDAHVTALLSQVRNSPPAAGVDAVLVPGELEARTRARRERDGVPLSEGVWSELSLQAARLGVANPAG